MTAIVDPAEDLLTAQGPSALGFSTSGRPTAENTRGCRAGRDLTGARRRAAAVWQIPHYAPPPPPRPARAPTSCRGVSLDRELVARAAGFLESAQRRAG